MVLASGWLFSGLSWSCKPTAEAVPSASAGLTDDAPSKGPDREVSGEGFAFGAPNNQGFSIGLRVEPKAIGEGDSLRYWMAFENQGKEILRKRLYDDNDFVYARTQLVAVEPEGKWKALGRAVGWNERSSAGFGVDVAMAPGQIKERQGNLFPLPKETRGQVDLMIVLGGPAYDFELRSGVVRIEVR